MIIFAKRHYSWRGKNYLVHSTYNDGTCDLVIDGELVNVHNDELEAVS